LTHAIKATGTPLHELTLCGTVRASNQAITVVQGLESAAGSSADKQQQGFAQLGSQLAQQ